jgi:hypothetical protein
MADRVQCFLLVPAEYAEVSLRRFTYGPKGDCPMAQYGHDASVNIGIEPYPFSEYDGEQGKGIEHNDPRWPKSCACGYHFKEDGEWQHNLIRMYRRVDRPTFMTTLRTAPVGSMWIGDWYTKFKGPDGRCLVVKTPGGDWIIDGPSRGNDGSQTFPWKRTGEIPRVTVTPSIHIPGKYHGWLKDGFLESVG